MNIEGQTSPNGLIYRSYRFIVHGQWYIVVATCVEEAAKKASSQWQYVKIAQASISVCNNGEWERVT